MTRLKPIGLTEADRQNPEESITPDRVKKLIDLYKKNHYHYPWTHEDKNERTFEYRKSLRPNTYQYRVEAIYRVRDPIDKSKEYYFYQKKGRILNQNDDMEYTNLLNMPLLQVISSITCTYLQSPLSKPTFITYISSKL
jgi:hypothetical protein